MTLRCGFPFFGVQVEVETIKPEGFTGAKWAAVGPLSEEQACALAGLCLSPFTSLEGVSLKRLSVQYYGGWAWVKATIGGWNSHSTCSKSWRVSTSSAPTHVLGLMRAWALAMSAINRQMALEEEGPDIDQVF